MIEGDRARSPQQTPGWRLGRGLVVTLGRTRPGHAPLCLLRRIGFARRLIS
jgi:hypothetical protein